MAGAHTEAALNKLSKPELAPIISNTEANLGSQIAKLATEVKDWLVHLKKLEADVVIVRNVNSKLVECSKLLGTMSLSRRFVTCFRKLAWIYVIVTFRAAIV